jgi:hypothetical protein
MSETPAWSAGQRALWSQVTRLRVLSRERDHERIAELLHPGYVGWDLSTPGTHDRTAAPRSVGVDAPPLAGYVLRPLSLAVYAGHTGVVHYASKATVAQPGGRSCQHHGEVDRDVYKGGGTLADGRGKRPAGCTPARPVSSCGCAPNEVMHDVS